MRPKAQASLSQLLTAVFRDARAGSSDTDTTVTAFPPAGSVTSADPAKDHAGRQLDVCGSEGTSRGRPRRLGRVSLAVAGARAGPARLGAGGGPQRFHNLEKLP